MPIAYSTSSLQYQQQRRHNADEELILAHVWAHQDINSTGLLRHSKTTTLFLGTSIGCWALLMHYLNTLRKSDHCTLHSIEIYYIKV